MNVNIDFAIAQEVDVKAGQTISSFSPPIQQVSTIHDLGYVLTKQHGDYVLEMNMGIKQDHMPLVPSKPHQVNVLPPKEIIYGSIPWSNTSVDENMTINLIVNAMMLIQIVCHILQQAPSEGTLSFETLDQVFKNISKDIYAATKKF